jgi:hypothetical protein
MPHRYKLVLFYAALLVLAFDLNAILQRLFSQPLAEVAWGKIVVAALLQGSSFAGAYEYLRWFGRKGKSLFAEDIWSPFRLVPLFAAGLVATFSTQVLHNAVNCSEHPFPSSSARTACPR